MAKVCDKGKILFSLLIRITKILDYTIIIGKNKIHKFLRRQMLRYDILKYISSKISIFLRILFLPGIFVCVNCQAKE